ncbi:smalltalk protein [Bacteroides sp. 519]|nr:smalltalk protein [Bacteroides sp. 519]
MKINSKAWDVILKVIIAAVSALAGALGANAMSL